MKKLLNYYVSISLIILFVLTLSITTNAQNITKKEEKKEATALAKHSIASVRLYDIKNTPGNASHYLIVILSDPQDINFQNQDLAPANLQIKFMPSGKPIPPSVIVSPTVSDPIAPDTLNLGPTDGQFRFLQIGLKDSTAQEEADSKPAFGDDRVEIIFNSLHFTGLTSPKKVTGIGVIYNSGNISKRVEETGKALKDAVANAKTTEEKDFFTDFNVIVPTKGGDTEGNVELVFNRNLRASNLRQAQIFDEINFGFQLNKATENKSDPRHFTVGLTFRKTFLMANRTKLNQIRDALNTGVLTDAIERRTLGNVADLQKDFVRALFFDNAIRFEADVSNRGISNVSNLLYDGNLQVATVSKSFLGRTGFINFRFLPVGFEVGANLTNGDNPALEKRSLFRFKIGAEMNLVFKSENTDDLINRVVFSAKGLNRYLFRKENIFDEASQTVISIDNGNKYWLQSDLRVMTGIKTGRGRVGFKATYNNGSLPPVYSPVKTFKFGLVFETTDDDNKDNIKP